MPDYVIRGCTFTADNCISGILVNPTLRPGFDVTPNSERSRSEINKWWNQPFIVTETVEMLDQIYAESEAVNKFWINDGRAGWMKAWPSGTRYEARCLDGGAWDRATSLGMFATVGEAIHCIEQRFGQLDQLQEISK